jgi:hypothetical protein
MMFAPTTFATLAATLVIAAPAFAHDEEALRHAPPAAPYAKVSDLVARPEFLPGLGTLYVNPETLPAGPFLGYDREGKLAATIYMTPIEALEGGTSFDDLAVGSHEVSSVDNYYNAGHPGVVAELPDELRLVFLMREVEGMSVLAVARDLSLTPVTVKTRALRARRRLRALLESRLSEGFDAIFPFDGVRCAGMADRVVGALKGLGVL